MIAELFDKVQVTWYIRSMLIDGKAIAKKIEGELKEKLAGMPQKKVCFIVFGDNPASKSFVSMKSNVAMRLNIAVDILEVPEPVSTSHAIEVIADAVRESYDGIVVQLPLPEGVDVARVLDTIPTTMDIDALREDAPQVAPVARAVETILSHEQIALQDKKIVVVGNGMLVGKPVVTYLRRLGFQPTVLEKETDQGTWRETLAQADIVITGAGVPCLIKPDMVKEGVVLIDAGTSESAGKLVGDVDPACAAKASYMTPVPGGVGPVTVISLFQNLLD
jgi:5,10-methylene-tetrahydrofolate dehydrogenase/methenyl tetrahydrofolate cyclohydrolase